jgi:hypothetical protein
MGWCFQTSADPRDQPDPCCAEKQIVHSCQRVSLSFPSLPTADIALLSFRFLPFSRHFHLSWEK